MTGRVVFLKRKGNYDKPFYATQSNGGVERNPQNSAGRPIVETCEAWDGIASKRKEIEQ